MEPKTSHFPSWSLCSSCDHSSFQTCSLVHLPPFRIFSDAIRPSFSMTHPCCRAPRFPLYLHACFSDGEGLHLGDTWNYLKTLLMVTAGLGDVATGTWWTELRDVGKRPTMQRISVHCKVLPVPKCQCCQG